MFIEITQPSVVFKDHLCKPENKRILFSAPFGYGKTYFLTEFFKVNSEYRPFWLSPIKYVVGQNEDIFEYIKIDIALQLLTMPDLRSDPTPDFREDLYIHQYLRNKPYEVAALLSKTLTDLEIPVLKQISSTVSNALKAREEYEAWKKEWKENAKSDFDKLVEFSLSHSFIKGSIFEDDIVTQLIRLSLEFIKEASRRNNVLIIDDFDRLDPEHIFRILNILSIHQNYTENENKFGFDKIIIVCSVDNIRKIFEHKYGLGASFDGYMEKFYSTDIFHFNNQSEISKYCRDNFSADLDKDALITLGLMLSHLVECNIISIRSIVKHGRIAPLRNFIIGQFAFPPLKGIWPNYYHQVPGGPKIKSETVWGDDFMKPIKDGVESFYISSSDFSFLKVIQILTTVLGDFNSLKEAIEKAKKINSSYNKNLNGHVNSTVLPLYNVIANIENPKQLFCSVEANRLFMNTAVFGNVNVDVIRNPSTSVLGVPVTINVKWNEENRYDGTTSYYSLASVEQSELANNTITQIFNLTGLILNYLTDSGHLGSLGLTK